MSGLRRHVDHHCLVTLIVIVSGPASPFVYLTVPLSVPVTVFDCSLIVPEYVPVTPGIEPDAWEVSVTVAAPDVLTVPESDPVTLLDEPVSEPVNDPFEAIVNLMVPEPEPE